MNSETRLIGELGVTSWLAANVVLPFRVFNTHIRYLDPQTGEPVTIEDPNLHHRNETLVGIADPWLIARAATTAAGFTLGARLGTTLPLGSTVPNPFVLGDMGLPHEHTQFGTGTFEPVAGVEGYRTFGGVTVDAYGLTIQSLYENHYGYQAGNRYAVGASAASSLGTKSWRFRATLDRFSESAERWNGMVNTSEGNIGRVDIMAGLEAAYTLDDDWRAAFSLKVPVYTHVVGGQVDVPLYATLTISTHVHLWKPRVVAPITDWAGLDKRDASTDGSAPPLEPVPGKLTVYDFWADWCGPCAQLDRLLGDVARRHPDAIAVRKINAVDSDSPAWTTYLAPGSFNLPHVKLFGRDGKLLWERTGSPAALAAAVEDALGPPPAPRAVAPATTPRIAITVTDAGFTPAVVTIPRDQPVVLVFTRTSEQTCAVDVHVALPDGTKIDERLPLNQPVEIPLRIDRAGDIPYACGMNMLHGTIEVR
ncbi:MAG: cupredoxin domain-containing protein [Deltaproteobacteria bacterium]|nr:cupredoxin domain-containing protein [Deltaproteobacteria bacterium]